MHKKDINIRFADLDLDDIVSEYDVVICSELPDTELFRVQFPQRKLKTFDSSVQPRIRYKKNVKLMEVRLSSNNKSGSFNVSRFTDGSNKLDMTSPKLDELYEGRAFSNSKLIQNTAGFIQDGTLYISPVAGSFDMQRVLSHMNKTGNQKALEDGDESDTEPSGQQLRVRFSRPETERQKKRREESALHREKLIASDQWIGMHVHPDGDVMAMKKLSALLKFNSAIELVSDMKCLPSIHNLVQRAILGQGADKVDILRSSRLVLSHKRIKNLNLDSQIKGQLSKAHAISTRSLLETLSLDSLSENVISSLRECACLVRGVWVLKSTYLFNDLPPAHSNVAGRVDGKRSKVWRKARDFCLCLIDFGHPVTEATLNRCFHLCSRDAVEILSTFCSPREGKWRFKLEEDREFLCRTVNLPLIVKAKKEWIRLFDELRKDLKF